MLTPNLKKTLNRAMQLAADMNHEYITLEHLLFSLMDDSDVVPVLKECNINIKSLKSKINCFLKNALDCIKVKSLVISKPTIGFNRIILRSIHHIKNMGKTKVNGTNLLIEFFSEAESDSVILLQQGDVNCIDLLNYSLNDLFSESGCASNSAEVYIDSSKKFNESSVLEKYCINLNKKAITGQLTPLVNREYELNRATDILLRKNKRNPLFIGDAGVGKTVIVEELATRIVEGRVPKALMNMTLYQLNMTAILAGTRYRGDFEERINNLLNEIILVEDIILFIDEVHLLIGAGSTNGNSLDAGNLLKPVLARNAFRFIGATTHKEYTSIFLRDSALSRRFHSIFIEEPSVDETKEVLLSIRLHYEEYHKVKYSKGAIDAIAEYADRYISGKCMPDKAIDVLDEAGAHYKCLLSDKRVITRTHILKIISSITSIPCDKIAKSFITRINAMSVSMRKKIIGQDKIIDQIAGSLKVYKSGLRDINKPIGMYLFLGPTGVGKTEMAKIIASEMEMRLLRFDMSEFAESHSVSKMIGAPPGYVGYETGGSGILTEKVLKYPHSLILLDEIDKAHKNLYNILLQIMDYGHLADSSGKSVNFRNTIIIMTGNDLSVIKNIGFGNSANDKGSHAAKEIFSLEFINRLDLITPFKKISRNDMRDIVTKKLSDIQVKLLAHNIKLNVFDEVYDFLIEKGYDGDYGVRAIDRVISEKISVNIATYLYAQGGKQEFDIRIEDDDLFLFSKYSSKIPVS